MGPDDIIRSTSPQAHVDRDCVIVFVTHTRMMMRSAIVVYSKPHASKCRHGWFHDTGASNSKTLLYKDCSLGSDAVRQFTIASPTRQHADIDGFTTQEPDAVSYCSIESLTRHNADMGNYVGFTTQEPDAVSHFSIASPTKMQTWVVSRQGNLMRSTAIASLSPHSEHRFPAPSSKLCQNWLRH